MKKLLFFLLAAISFGANAQSVYDGMQQRLVLDGKFSLTTRGDSALNERRIDTLKNAIVNAATANVIGTITNPSQSPSGSETAGQGYRVTNSTSSDVVYTNFSNDTVPANTSGIITKQSAGNWVFNAIPKPSLLNSLSGATAGTAALDAALGTQLAINGGSVKTVYQIDTSKVDNTKLFDISYSINQYDSTQAVTGYYVDLTSGGLTASSTSAVSAWIPLNGSYVNYLSGLNFTPTNCYIRYKDASGTLLKPYQSNGSPFSTFASTYNSVQYAPPTAVAVQFTVKFVGTGTSDSIMWQAGSTKSPYVPYSKIQVVKLSVLPSSVKGALPAGSYTGTADSLNLKKVNNSDLFDAVVGKNKFDYAQIIPGYYVDLTTGNLTANSTSAVSAWIPLNGASINYLSGRNYSPNSGYIRYKDASGTILKPYQSNGLPFSTFSGAYKGAQYAPPTAVAVQFTVKFAGSGTLDSIQFENGATQTAYEPYTTSNQVKPSLLPAATTVSQNTLFTVIKSGTDTYVESSFDSTHNIVVQYRTNTATNGSLNILAAKLISKTDDIVSSSGLPLTGASADDACPTNRADIGYCGGNHGYNVGIQITMTAHGKTVADIGSSYTDGSGKTFYILKIIDANNILVCSANTGTASHWTFTTTINGNLTYVANGVNTATIVPASTAVIQILPSTKNATIQLFGDKQLLTKDSTYYVNDLYFTETYDIIDFPAMLDSLIANIPVGGYSSQPDLSNGPAAISIRNVYNVQEQCKQLLSWSWIAREDVYFNYFGGTQSAFSHPSWSPNILRYFPNALPINLGNATYDFRNPVNINTPWTTEGNLTSAYWESGRPVSRVVDLLDNGSGVQVNFNMGFLPVASQSNRSAIVNNAWYLYTSEKLYPYAFDSKTFTGNVVPAGTILQGACFRGWSDKPSTKMNKFSIDYNGSTYVFVDWQTAAGNDLINIDDSWLGKSISVVESTSNINILGTTVTGPIDANVGSNTATNGQYGHVTLKLN